MAGESAAYLAGTVALRRKPWRFFSYYGSKNGSAAKYPPPQHEIIHEPFAGAAGYSTLHYKKRVVLSDIDPIICGVWQYLIRVTPEEILQLPIVTRWDAPELSPWPQEARWLIGFWLAMGQATPFNKQTSYAQTRARSSWSAEIRYKLSLQVNLIKHWQIIEGSYENLPNSPATWLIDPPYQQPAGAAYTHGNRGIGFTRLGEWCRNLPGQVIVCEAGAADWLPFEFFARGRTVASQLNNIATNRELLYYQINGKQESWTAH